MVEEHLILRSAPVSGEPLEAFATSDAGLDVTRIVDESHRCALFVLVGDLDVGTSPQLLEHLVAAARRPPVDLVIIELSRVRFVGAAGANCLEAAWRAGERSGAQVVVSRPTFLAQRMLETAGLATLFDHDHDARDDVDQDRGWRWDTGADTPLERSSGGPAGA